MSLRRSALALLAAALISACYPYQNREGEYLAGAVDPGGFPDAYLGQGGDPKLSGGKFKPAVAYVSGLKIGYYGFPLPDTQTTLNLFDVIPIANVYVFDPGGPAKCVAPKDYVYDQRRDMVRYDEQGAVFTRLPNVDDPGDQPSCAMAGGCYSPLVAEVAVTSRGEKCQDIKSEETLLQSKDVDLTKGGGSTPTEVIYGIPDGKYLAWALIDPSADVLPHGTNGLGPQGWGWYNHYLTAYIEGGYIPTIPNTVGADPKETVAVAQLLYYPTTHPKTDAMGNTSITTHGNHGDGYDLVQFRRSDAGYSPICHVFAFLPTDPMKLPTSIDEMDPNETASVNAADADQGFIYCLQAQ